MPSLVDRYLDRTGSRVSYRPKLGVLPETERASLRLMAFPRKRRSVASRMSFSRFSVRVHPIGFH